MAQYKSKFVQKAANIFAKYKSSATPGFLGTLVAMAAPTIPSILQAIDDDSEMQAKIKGLVLELSGAIEEDRDNGHQS